MSWLTHSAICHLLKVVVHAADIQYRDGAKLVLTKLSQAANLWRLCGALIDWVREFLGAILQIVLNDPSQPGFRVLSGRWAVERTFAWFRRYHRLAKDYEQLTTPNDPLIIRCPSRILVA